MNRAKRITFPKSGAHVGDLCGWSLHGPHTQQAVTELAAQHDLVEDLGLPRLSPSSGYRRAVVAACKGQKADERSYAAVKIEETDAKIVHAIVKRSIVEDADGSLSKHKAESHTECKVGFDKDGYREERPDAELLQLSNPEHIVAQRVKAQYESLCVMYLAKDIRIAFQRAFLRWGAIRMLESGGLWWVPEPFAHKVRDWDAFMDELKYSTVVIPIFDTEETIRSLVEQSEQTLEAQLNGMLSQLTQFAAKGGTRVSTLERRVEMFDDLRGRVELHARVLGNKQDELLARLDAAHQGLVQSLAQLTT